MFRGKKMFLVCLALMSALTSVGQVPGGASYFADGFHGGVYGHYPLDSYTDYMMQQLDQHPEWRIGLEIEPETWDSVKVRTPDAYRRWQQAVVSPQVEYTNPAYAQPYMYNILGESIIRQFQYGIRKLHEHFPTMTFTTYATEEPCFTSCLPQILSQLGFRHAVLKCPDTCWGGYTEAYGGELVNWIGPDGSSLLSVPRYACEALEDSSVWQTKAWKNSRDYLRACRQAGIEHPVGMCYQDAGWKYGPWLGPNHRSQYVRWTDYIEQIADSASATDYRMPQEHVLPALVWGSQVMQRIGRQVRYAEHLLLEAERLSSMQYILTGRRPDRSSLDEAWRTLMLAQHHDSWIVPYNRLNSRGTWADNIALWTDKTCQLAQSIIRAALSSAEGDGSTVCYNTTGKTRKAVVTGVRSDGSVIDFQVELPSFGWVVVDANRLELPKTEKHIKLSKGSATMENERYRLVFDLKRGGVLTSLYDKQQGREVVDKSNVYGFGELRGFFGRDGRFRSSAESAAKARVVKDNAFVQSLCVAGEIAGVPFTQTYTLRKDEPQIDVELDIDWKRNLHIGNHRQRKKGDPTVPFYNTRYALSVFLPAALNQPKLWKDAPFDVCESRLDSTFFDRWTDIRHNIILSWVDVADKESGLALLSDHTTSYSFSRDYPLALTVQYSGGGLWGRDHKITGKTQLRYALVPHRGHWDEAGVSDISEAWNRSSFCCQGGSILPQQDSLSFGEGRSEASLLSLDGTGYQLSSMTVDADGSVLMRLYNACGDDRPHDIRIDLPVKSVTEVDLQGNEVSRPPYANHRLTVQMPRFGIRTYRMRWLELSEIE